MGLVSRLRARSPEVSGLHPQVAVCSDVLVATGGGRNPDYQEADGQRVMKQAEITVRVTLGRGEATATVWTCDLSHDYVSINADYRS